VANAGHAYLDNNFLRELTSVRRVAATFSVNSRNDAGEKVHDCRSYVSLRRAANSPSVTFASRANVFP